MCATMIYHRAAVRSHTMTATTMPMTGRGAPAATHSSAQHPAAFPLHRALRTTEARRHACGRLNIFGLLVSYLSTIGERGVAGEGSIECGGEISARIEIKPPLGAGAVPAQERDPASPPRDPGNDSHRNRGRRRPQAEDHSSTRCRPRLPPAGPRLRVGFALASRSAGVRLSADELYRTSRVRG